MCFHPGGTVGFASELVVIPELDIGFALMTNKLDMTSPIGRMATYRLLEMLTGGEQDYDRQIGVAQLYFRFQLLQLKFLTRKKVNPEKVAPFLGNYHHPLLGDIELVLHDNNTLWVDFGEYESSVRRLIIEDNPIYLLRKRVYWKNHETQYWFRWKKKDSVGRR